MTELSPVVGIKISPGVELEIAKELLNIAGIPFEIITEADKYACVIDSASINEILQLDNVFHSLSGTHDKHYLENKLLEVPIDEYVIKLVSHIKDCLFKQGLPLIQKWYWPNFAPACALITHDIDTMNNPPPSSKKGQFVKYGVSRKMKKLPFSDNIDNILEIENDQNVKSTFFFFSDYGKFNDYFRQTYCQSNILPGEIGLHGSQHSFQHPEMMVKEKAQLGKEFDRPITGIRQHGLNFMVPQTWRYQQQAGFDYDLSFYYNDKFGFRAGTCHPYHPFDSLTKERFDILEIPTSFMDWTAVSKGMNLTAIENEIRKLAGVIEKYHGIFVLNYHNMYINKNTHPEIIQAFESTIKYLKEKRYWITTVGECAEWWKRREKPDIDIPFVIEYPDGRVQKEIIDVKFKLEIEK